MAKVGNDLSVKKIIHLETLPTLYAKLQGDLLVDRADENELRNVFNKARLRLTILHLNILNN
jgi:hypothetical protein